MSMSKGFKYAPVDGLLDGVEDGEVPAECYKSVTRVLLKMGKYLMLS
jgi:hypothetical protein